MLVKLSIRDMAVGTFVPMLESLAGVLAKGAEHAASAQLVGTYARRRG